MLISSYSLKGTDDILIVMIHPNVSEQSFEIKNGIVHIYDAKNNTTLGYNFLSASKIIPDLVKHNGPFELSQKEIDTLNQVLNQNGFSDQIKFDPDPKFVVGYVESTKPHPDSDHLQITQTKINNGKTVQIVSGSPNMREHIKVVVAKVGAIMPSGMIIEPGKLRGVESDGMICAGYELNLKNAPQKPGALILPDEYQVGSKFDFNKANHLFD
ncbi:tRNA-binding protein [Philodulcilactobacillus myokoensis]|uniref:tRNA-binding protein n=1 Tax=Philodulcilactobacillus myokoensis TaxID=2929573 RepID=A0A9W6B0K6_9LACO|nr:DUF4479 and tRNA-binding domain-containing protein [Philodulcilactobacillus myokoensis]GLB46742.1 tRNA-binding protein [Philodulcilactobacillus myokoensis]